MAKGLKELLKEKLSCRQLKLLPNSFDVIGDILVFASFPKELEKKEKVIGNAILRSFKNIKVVCRKTKQYSGTFRTPKIKVIVGARRKETEHRENGVRVKLDVEKVYFSPRLSHERERINKLIKEGEEVLVMFSGCGIYCINISKNSKAKKIYGVEINPVAHDYGLQNIKLNKAENVKLVLGDVKKVLPSIKKKFDRVLMPLPKSAVNFLDVALSKVKQNGIIHFYDFLHERDFKKSEIKIEEACKKINRNCQILMFVKCGQYGPGKYRVCVDAKIT